MKRFCFFLFLFLLFKSNIFAQKVDKPEITCLSVQKNGDVAIEWENMENLIEGKIWCKKNDDVDFKMIHSFKPNEKRHLHFLENGGANANTISYYIANITPNGIFNSETLETLFLKTEYKTDVSIKLSWNKLHDDNKEVDYDIKRERGFNGKWTDIKENVKETSFIDSSLNACINAYRYQIVSGCHSSNIPDTIKKEGNKPAAPHLYSLNVIKKDLKENLIELKWERSKSEDAAGYIILKKNDKDLWETIETIENPDIESFIEKDFSYDCNSVRTYRIITRDRCENTSTDDNIVLHNLILHPPAFNHCYDILLNWEPYGMLETEMGTKTPLDGYNILYSIEGKPFQSMEKPVPKDSTSRLFKINEQGKRNYSFKIEAFNDSKKISVTSCERNIDVDIPIKPTFGNILYASVNEEGDVDLCFHVDIAATKQKYILQRSSTGVEDSYQTIETLDPTGKPIIKTTDPSADVNNYSYYYKFYTSNNCGDTVFAENKVRNILLKVKLNQKSQVELQWTNYDGFLKGLDEYVIYRKIDEENYEPIASKTDTIYIDEEIKEDSYHKNILYTVVAISRSDENNIQYKAWSNQRKLLLESPTVFFPNAFRPNSDIEVNQKFKPIFTGIDVDKYQLIIYNRWGETIFSTTDQKAGWDGKTKNGKQCETGSYIYQFTMTDKEGNRYQKTGSVVLLY